MYKEDFPAGLSVVDVCLAKKKKEKHVKNTQHFSCYGKSTQSCKISHTSTAFIYMFEKMCVCVFSSHSFWTSSSLDVPAGVTQEEVRTGFLIHLLSAVRALIFLARRIQPFLSLVDREVEFCVLTI